MSDSAADSRSRSEIPTPPAPPQIPVRIRLRWPQIIGMSALAVIPALALFGVFGVRFGHTSAAAGPIEMELKYPQRFRYKTIETLEVRIRNTSDDEIGRIIVSFDENYISEFSNVVFTPTVERVYEVELNNVAPGETRIVAVELQAEWYWRHEGTITASVESIAGGSPIRTDHASAKVSTIVFP